MTTLKESSAIEQLNKLIEFRQIVYDEVFIEARDVQFETIDSLLLSDHPRSFAELSLSPVFRRQWSSLYDAVERGRQDEERLERLLVKQVPTQGVQVFPLDTTMWSHPRARTLPDLVYAPSPTRALKHRSIVQGHQYSLISWAPEAGSSWAPVILSRRVKASESEIEVGVAQVKQLCRYRLGAELTVITADGSYGTHHFFAPLKQTHCALVARLRCDRVLYGEPGVYGGRGRPRKHGDRFAFKEPGTWPEPNEVAEYEHPDWGQVRLQAWHQLHARQDADTPFHVIRAEVHQQRLNPPPPLWLAYVPAADQDHYPVQQVWGWFTQRWPIEPAIRFRKQHLAWTLPRLQTADACDRWTRLVDLAGWQLFLARNLVQDQPLPWQKAQMALTPARVQRSLGALFAQFDSPAQPPKTRRNSTGWPKGRTRTRPERYKPVKRGRSRASPT
jgi:hypothetical protein